MPGTYFPTLSGKKYKWPKINKEFPPNIEKKQILKKRYLW